MHGEAGGGSGWRVWLVPKGSGEDAAKAHHRCHVPPPPSAPLARDIVSERVPGGANWRAWVHCSLSVRSQVTVFKHLLDYHRETALDHPGAGQTPSMVLQIVAKGKDFAAGLAVKGRPAALTFGALDELLGTERLALVHFFESLLHLAYPEVVAMFVDLRLFADFLRLFFTYKFNNLLHNSVTKMIFIALNGVPNAQCPQPISTPTYPPCIAI
eukprot:SAG22_NODE_1282_length_4892_cov_20.004173_4_plen_213_part_00